MRHRTLFPRIQPDYPSWLDGKLPLCASAMCVSRLDLLPIFAAHFSQAQMLIARLRGTVTNPISDSVSCRPTPTNMRSVTIAEICAEDRDSDTLSVEACGVFDVALDAPEGRVLKRIEPF